MKTADLVKLWDVARNTPPGVAIETDDRKLLQAQLYKARTEVGDYDDLVIIIPKTEGELWIAHKNANE